MVKIISVTRRNKVYFWTRPSGITVLNWYVHMFVWFFSACWSQSNVGQENIHSVAGCSIVSRSSHVLLGSSICVQIFSRSIWLARSPKILRKTSSQTDAFSSSVLILPGSELSSQGGYRATISSTIFLSYFKDNTRVWYDFFTFKIARYRALYATVPIRSCATERTKSSVSCWVKPVITLISLL